MLGSDNFTSIFDNHISTDRVVTIKAALKAGFFVTINEMNLSTPMCILSAREIRVQNELAAKPYLDQGLVAQAEKTKHECGLAHALGPNDASRVTTLLKRLTNSVNIGLHLGKSGYVVINANSDEEKQSFIDTWNESTSPIDISLPTVKTPGTKIVELGEEIWHHQNGAHWWFKIPEGWVLPTGINKIVTRKGWSILLNENQALVPPSSKPEGKYQLQNSPLELPPWLFGLIVKKAEEAELNSVLDVPVVSAGRKSPFTQAAQAYREKGWNPFPIVRDGAKYKPFRKGHTGRTGKNLTNEEITYYADSSYDLSIALRMNKGVLAIDVDGYDEKDGRAGLFHLEESLGPLPATFRNTARKNDKVSGHYFFKVPEDVKIMDRVPNRNIEILQFHHRYANTWPTKNAKTYDVYRWYDKDGNLTEEGFVPSIEELPELPPAWVKYLTKPEPKEHEKIDPENIDDYMRQDGQAIIDRSVRKLSESGAGNRNNQLNTTSYLLGRMVSAGIIDTDEAETLITEACQTNGLFYEDSTEVNATFSSGMNAGIDNPWTPETLEFIDPEPIVTADWKEEVQNNILKVLQTHKNPALSDISLAFEDIVRVCKENDVTKGQTVTIVMAWGNRFGISPDQVSIDVGRLWEYVDFHSPRLRARDAKRIIRKHKFLWKGRIPLGGLTLMAGEGEAGKTTFLAWIVAQVTNGALSGDLHGTPRNVLYVRPEASWDEVLTQLMIVDANLDRIKEVVLELPSGADRPPTLPDDIPGFLELCEEYDPALVIFDPLPARLNSKLSANADSDVRQALEPLTHLAQQRQMAICGLQHFSKNSDTNAISKVMNSVAFVNIARSVLLVAYNSETGRRFIGVSKTNVAHKPNVPTIEFRIVEDTVEAETENGMEEIPGTKIELVTTDERSIDKIIYEHAAIVRAMRDKKPAATEEDN